MVEHALRLAQSRDRFSQTPRTLRNSPPEVSPGARREPLQVDTARAISYEQFLQEYEGLRAEWKEGQVIPMVACSYPHQRLVGFLHRLLGWGVETRWGGELLVAPFQMKTGPDLPGREPDLLYLSEARRDQLQRLFIDGAADLAVEVVSPDSRLRDRGEKYAEYEMGGVREYWLLDPDLERADFYCLGEDGRFERHGTPEGVFTSQVLQGLKLPVAWLWSIPSVPQCVRELGWL